VEINGGRVRGELNREGVNETRRAVAGEGREIKSGWVKGDGGACVKGGRVVY